MRYALVVVLLGVLCSVSPVAAQVSIGIGLPGVSIGINLPVFPELVVVPGYPVYYAPREDVNLFFYDGMYWAYQTDNWYASSWYNGPWQLVGPETVPAFVLRIPVRYYRHAPANWRGWRADAPPRWGERWGHEWEQRRSGWDQWDRHTTQAPAPLPVYQRQYAGGQYPRAEQQQTLNKEKYRYQPQDPLVRQHAQQQGAQPQPAAPRQQVNQRSSPPPPPQQVAPAVSHSQPSQPGGESVRRSAAPVPPQQGAPAVQHEQRPQPVAAQHEQQAPTPPGQHERSPDKEQSRADTQPPQQGPERGQEQERGQGHNK